MDVCVCLYMYMWIGVRLWKCISAVQLKHGNGCAINLIKFIPPQVPCAIFIPNPVPCINCTADMRFHNVDAHTHKHAHANV